MPPMNTATLDASAPVNPVPLQQDAAVIGLVGLAHGTSHFSHLLLAPLFPIFMRDFGLSYSDVGLLMTIFFVISGSGQAMAGFVVDRIGARPVLFAAITPTTDAETEGGMAVGLPVDDHLVGPVHDLGIAVGGRERQEHLVAGVHRAALELHVLQNHKCHLQHSCSSSTRSTFQ